MHRLVICLAMPLAGCGTIFDPAPYNPRADQTVLNPTKTQTSSYDAVTILTFSDANDAAHKLQALSNGYGDQRDNLMRQQELFDIPMIGLAAAAVINPLFHGAKNATLALGLGAVAAGGAKLYYGPQAKVTAYNTASLALGCAATAASGIDQEIRADGNNGAQLATNLTANISIARPLVSSNAALMAARDQALKSLDALQAALAAVNGAPATLQAFGNTVIRTATNQVVTNVQNVSAVEQLIAGGAGGPKAAPPAGAAAAAAKDIAKAAADVDVAQLTSDLQSESTSADAISQRANAAMAALQKCSGTS